MLGAQLEFAVGDGDVGLVDELLENGANPNHAVDKYGSLIIYACAEVEDDHVVYSLTKSLLEHGADVNAVDCHGATALFDATYLDKVEIAELLIKHGADVHHVDSDGDHALNHACRFHAIEGAKLLLRHGADVNSLDSEGQSPLLCTLQSLVFYEEPNKYGQSASQLANFLISEGANVKIVDVHGNDALFYAQENHVVLHANN